MTKQTRSARVARRIATIGVAVFALVVALPMIAQAWNALQTPKYDWYTSGVAGTESDPYLLSSLRDYRGFVNIVNGTADIDGDGQNDCDSFEGKYVKLTTNLSLATAGESNVIDPIGGAQTGKTFNGTFDGDGHTIDNYTVTTTSSEQASNLGLFGACGPSSVIKNVTVGNNAQLSIIKGTTDVIQIRNVGLLVGYTEGSMESCINNGKVFVQTNYNQTEDLKITILNVGGLAGQCLGNVTNCANNGTIEGYAYGAPRSLTAEEIAADKRQEPIIAMNIAGVVGCAGTLDSLVEENSEATAGVVSGCTNSAKISTNSPSEAGLDRFNSTVYAENANIAGVVGYSRGSVYDCTNRGYIRAENGTYAAGVVGSLRAHSLTVSAAAPTARYDDGMLGVVEDETLGVSGYDEAASEAAAIYLKNCHNDADVMGHSSPGGVVGAAGTYTVIEGCTNSANSIVMGTRWNKPFPSGIVASVRGKVQYCANYGTILSGRWSNEAERTYTLQDGYYVSGIAGNTRSYEDKHYNRISPVPEVVGCYNVGKVLAGDNMRQRGIAGDNEGNVTNTLLVEGVVYKDRIAYGLYDGDDESAGGVYSNNYVIPSALLKSNGWFSFVSEDKYLVQADEQGTMNALTVLNASGDRTGWGTYWVEDKTSSNNGYPVLNTSVDWELTPITSATVELEANAQYTSVVGAVPHAKVTLNGVELVQGVDFRVVPDQRAVVITTDDENPKPYTATIVGIGNYTGTATQTLSYGIDAGDFASCTVSIEVQRFDWTAHELNPEDVTVTTISGERVDPSEYTVALDESDSTLTVNEQTGAKEAVNSGKYDVIVSAVEGAHFYGTVSGEMTIQAASILYSLDANRRPDLAIPTSISYAGETYDWESTIYLASKAPEDQIPAVTFEYTGHPVDPEVVSVVYKNVGLVEGRDYRVMYGDTELLESGITIPAGTENIGVKGGIGYGYIMVKNVPGGNFSNYEIMKFTIADTEAKVDLAGAEVRGNEDVIYEGEQSYEPVTVWYQNQQLTEGVDYTISYSNNTGLGEARYVVTACSDGPFGGEISGTFNIVQGASYKFYYTYDDTAMTATVTGVAYSGINETYDVEIPATTVFAGGEYTKIVYANNAYTTETATAAAGTYTVTAIGDYAFGGGGTRGSSAVWTGSDFALSKVGITSVVIPYTVKTIGKFAFAGGSTYTSPRLLSSVTFGNVEYSQLTTIEEGAFQACGNLTEFTFPAGVTTIGKSAFRVGTNGEPSKIKTLTFLTQDPSLPSSVSTSYAFAGIGGNAATATVTVYCYDSATKVKSLVSANATTSSYGSNKGMRFSASIMEEPEVAWSVAETPYVAGTDKVLVTYEALEGNYVPTLNGLPMEWDGERFVMLASSSDAAAITSASFSIRPTTGELEALVRGDVNLNDRINIVDAQAVYRMACGAFSDYSVVIEAGWIASDYNADGHVDSSDAFALQRFIHSK